MFRDLEKLKRDLERFEELRHNFFEKPFDAKKVEVQKIEEEIRRIVGVDPSYTIINRHKEDLDCLLEDRRVLLDWMFLNTPIEVGRMKVVNQRLFDLTQQLRTKMAVECEVLVNRERDDFDDDYEVEGTLRFCFNGEDSILSYEGDEMYGSDFALMIQVRDYLNIANQFGRLELSSRYNDSRENILNAGNCDDGQSWGHDIPGDFDDILICHTTCRFIRDFGFPLVDFLHLNDFWSEVHVRFQHFTTQDPNYQYLRD